MNEHIRNAALRTLEILPNALQRPAVELYRRRLVHVYDGLRRILGSGAYRRWVKLYDTISREDRLAIIADIEGFADRPPISIVTPVFNPPERHLRAALDSVFD